MKTYVIKFISGGEMLEDIIEAINLMDLNTKLNYHRLAYDIGYNLVSIEVISKRIN